MTNTEKLETILRHDFIEWQTMSKDQILELLTESHRFFLEAMLGIGNGLYLDDRLEEINIPETWEKAIQG
jgi:chloramphenicol 3-O-phosphotransferase